MYHTWLYEFESRNCKSKLFLLAYVQQLICQISLHNGISPIHTLQFGLEVHEQSYKWMHMYIMLKRWEEKSKYLHRL